jgi:hypothetical protein
MPFAVWWTVRAKSSLLPLLVIGVVIVAAVLAVIYYGALELSSPQQSLLSRLWNVKHPEHHVAGCLILGAVFSLFVWFVLFDIAMKESGWHLVATPRVAKGIFFQNGTLSVFFLGVALYPWWALGLAVAYLLGAAQHARGAYLLLFAVGLTCTLAAIGSVHTLWLHVPATYFAFLSARAA